jgi:2-succinyl-5-enolpyruvyl-6-hydroxy-3-cyclohexene-1-carboxylate synthase
MNISWSQKIFSELFNQGVRDVVVCGGARNAPLVFVLSRISGFRVHSFFDERAAGFFALGLSRRTGKPAAVVTTSGTAVAELLPAVIEAYHTGFPIIVISADRPRRLRGTGAPQAIDQVGLFGKFIGQEFDLENGELFELSSWNRRTPLHINVCLDEPLLDEEIRDVVLSEADALLLTDPAPFATGVGAEWASIRLTKFLRSGGPLIVIVGTLDNEKESAAVEDFLLRLNAPVYLEATSGLREKQSLESIALRSGDKLLTWALKKKLVGRVLRIGGVPTVRIWRDLDEAESPIDVLSLSTLPFSGLSRGELLCTSLAETLRACQVAPLHAFGTLLSQDRKGTAVLADLLDEEPQAEPSLVLGLSRLIPDRSKVYVGNSLPIREWDLAASFERCFHIEANRGVNGIDGQMSTFLGLADVKCENWALLGDLTTLYDLSGPWALRAREPELKIRLVVLNNGGGKIFNRIFNNSLFENSHEIDFSDWAKMWRLGYQRWTQIPSWFEGTDAEVIELIPDPNATTRFWSRYDSFWAAN